MSHTEGKEPRPKGRKPAPPAAADGPAKQPRSSWLEGPAAALPPAGAWPGERLGLPQEGVGSMAGYGRRIVALLIDWIASYGVALVLNKWLHWSQHSFSWLPWFVFVFESTVLVALIGATFGQAIMGMRVIRVDSHGRPSPPASFLRAFLIGLVIPAVVTDRDGRGLHDRTLNTVLINAR